MHEEYKAYQSLEIQSGHHVEATDFRHAHLHEKIHMQANFQTCNILFQDTHVCVQGGRHRDTNCI